MCEFPIRFQLPIGSVEGLSLITEITPPNHLILLSIVTYVVITTTYQPRPGLYQGELGLVVDDEGKFVLELGVPVLLVMVAVKPLIALNERFAVVANSTGRSPPVDGVP